jgi:hypothetical protein
MASQVLGKDQLPGQYRLEAPLQNIKHRTNLVSCLFRQGV